MVLMDIQDCMLLVSGTWWTWRLHSLEDSSLLDERSDKGLRMAVGPLLDRERLGLRLDKVQLLEDKAIPLWDMELVRH